MIPGTGRKIYLHAGARKTASTSLQRALRVFKEDDKTLFWDRGGELINKVVAFDEISDDERDGGLHSLQKGLTSTRKNIIFSTESIYQLNFTQQKSLLDAIKVYCDEIEVVFIVRNLSELAASETRQLIREQRLNLKEPLSLGLTNWIAGPLVEDSKTKLTIRDYGHLIDENSNSVAGMLELFDIETNNPKLTIVRTNQSGSRIASQLAWRLHRILQKKGVSNRRQFRSLHLFLEQEFPLGVNQALDKNTLSHFLSDHEDDLEILRAFGINYPSTPKTNLELVAYYLDDLDEELALRVLYDRKHLDKPASSLTLDKALLALYREHRVG